MGVSLQYRIEELGVVADVPDREGVKSVGAGLELVLAGDALDLADDAAVNWDVTIAAKIRAGLPDATVYDGLDVTNAETGREGSIQVRMVSGPTWESAGTRQVDIPITIGLRIEVLAPATRAALTLARTLVLAAVRAASDPTADLTASQARVRRLVSGA